MALGPLLEGCKIPCPDRIPVIRLMMLQQPVADQQRHATLSGIDTLTATVSRIRS